MPRSLARPTPAQIAAIHNTFVECDLTPVSRRRLRSVLAWANGKTTRQVAADKSLNMSDFSVRTAIHLYLKNGVAPFVTPPPPARGGRPPTSPELKSQVLKLLREGGTDVTYRDIKAQTGVSLGTISKIAKRLNPSSRPPRA